MPDLTTVANALAAGARASSLESAELEFKEQDPTSLKRTLEILADAVVCLANATGGAIVVGIDDHQSGMAAMIGVDSTLTKDLVIRGVFDRTRPPLSVPVSEDVVDGRRLLTIQVPKGATLYANAKGTATRRVGAECRPFPPDEQRQALASRGLYDWSAETCAASADDLLEEEITKLRRLLRTAGKDDLADLDSGRLLRDLRLVTATGAVTRTAVLLLGRPDALEELIPNYGYAYQYRPTPGSESTTRFRERRPLLAAIERLLDAIDARSTVRALNVGAGVQVQLHDYPLAAVRELAVNALVHRDYEVDGAVEIEHTADRLMVNSPGGLVFGVTPENILTHPSTPRNRLLLEVVTMLQVAERTGQGIDRAYREMLRSGKQPPTFRDHGSRVEAVLPGGKGNDSFARFVTKDLDDDLARDLDALLTLDLLRERKSVSAKILAPHVQRSEAEAERTLRALADRGLIVPARRSATKAYPSYTLTATALADLGRSVSYHRPATEQTDHKVAEHVNEYGFITNQTLRRLFDLGMYPARDLLRDLQTRGVLRKLDGQTSGPGVRYGPGPQFPSRSAQPQPARDTGRARQA